MRRSLLVAAMAFLACFGLVLPLSAQLGDPSFNLVNRSGRVIYEAYASPVTATQWGPDRLGQNVIPPGRNFVIRLPFGECVYDVRVVYDRAGGPAEEWRSINLCTVRDLIFEGRGIDGRGSGQQQQGAAQSRPPQGNPSFNLVNHSRRTVMQAFASLTTDSNWGPDRLGVDIVPPGYSYPIRLPEGDCFYDLRFVYDDGQAEEQRNVNLCEVINIVLPLR